MSFQTSEQLLHDRVNLARLVRRLEKTIASEEWNEDGREPGRATWIKTQGTLQKLKYARRLLKTVELNEELDNDQNSSQRYEDLRKILDRLEYTVTELDKRAAPKAVRPAPILPSIPPPVPSIRTEPATSSSASSPNAELSALGAADPDTSMSAQDLLLSPSDTTIIPSTLLPSASSALSAAKPTSTPAGTPGFLQNSAALQEELSEQLAQMATQLKRNAVHFAGSLDKDKAVILEAQEKLERNFDVLTKERVRLRDHRSKSWGTTWIVILSLVVALIGFFLTFFVIRFT